MVSGSGVGSGVTSVSGTDSDSASMVSGSGAGSFCCDLLFSMNFFSSSISFCLRA